MLFHNRRKQLIAHLEKHGTSSPLAKNETERGAVRAARKHAGVITQTPRLPSAEQGKPGAPPLTLLLPFSTRNNSSNQISQFATPKRHSLRTVPSSLRAGAFPVAGSGAQGSNFQKTFSRNYRPATARMVSGPTWCVADAEEQEDGVFDSAGRGTPILLRGGGGDVGGGGGRRATPTAAEGRCCTSTSREGGSSGRTDRPDKDGTDVVDGLAEGGEDEVHVRVTETAGAELWSNADEMSVPGST